MAKFDVFRSPEGGLWLDCQNDLLRNLNTRLVVPLASPDDVIQIESRLNPVLDVAGEEMVMLTHFAASVPTSVLGRRICSIAEQDYAASTALDFLISGY